MATILIADDNRNIRDMLCLALQLSDHQVFTAANGHQAIEQLNDQDIDLLLTDWHMPEMGGEELIRALMDWKEYQDLPVMVLSACPQPSNDLTKKTSPIRVWLMKPCRISLIQETALKIINCSANQKPQWHSRRCYA